MGRSKSALHVVNKTDLGAVARTLHDSAGIVPFVNWGDSN